MQLKPVRSGKHRWMQSTSTLFPLRLGLVLGLIALHAPQLRADVVITSPSGGNNVSADKALNSTNGAAFTALGSIVITEGASTDLALGNCHPSGTVRTSVWLLPSAQSVEAPSVITMLPNAVNAAPLVELSALSAETLLPPVGEVMTTSARSCGACNAINPKTRPRRSGNRVEVDCIQRCFPERTGFNCMSIHRLRPCPSRRAGAEFLRGFSTVEIRKAAR